MTEEQRQALKQILTAAEDQYRLTGKWSYFAPGGWAGDRLLELLEGKPVVWRVVAYEQYGGDHPTFANLEPAKRYVERQRNDSCVWDKSDAHGEIHYFIPSILSDASKYTRRERAWFAIIKQEIQ